MWALVILTTVAASGWSGVSGRHEHMAYRTVSDQFANEKLCVEAAQRIQPVQYHCLKLRD